MYKVALVDDEAVCTETITEYLNKYREENGTEFYIRSYSNALDFLNDFTKKPDFDLIFLDIEMPNFSGLELAKEIRTLDETVGIIFITNMGQLAIKGYEVSALDFIVKPVKYFNFSLKLNKAISRLTRKFDKEVVIDMPNGKTKLLAGKISYVEVDKHYLIYHYGDQLLRTRGTIKNVEEELWAYGFLRCNNYTIINYRYIASYKGSTVILNDGTEVLISRPRKAAFLEKLGSYLGDK